MDYSKKHEISVYLTEEQLNQRIAEIGAQITERFKRRVGLSGLYPERDLSPFTTELAKRIALPMTIDFYISIQLWSTDPFFRCRKYQEGS